MMIKYGACALRAG